MAGVCLASFRSERGGHSQPSRSSKSQHVRYTWDTGKGKPGNIFCELNKDLRMIPKVPLGLAAKIREAWAPFMNAMFSGLRTCPKVTDTMVYRGRWGLTCTKLAPRGLTCGPSRLLV